MKNQNNYNRFVLDGNATTCVSGNTIVKLKTFRGKFFLFKKLANFFLRKLNI
jgi:hypothetical protein